MQIAIGEARLADSELLAQLEPGHPSSRRWLVAERGGEPVGMALPSSEAGEELLTLHHVGMVPGARGEGAGRALLLAVLHRAREEGATTYLGSTDEGNTAMIRLFQRVGAEEAARREVFHLE